MQFLRREPFWLDRSDIFILPWLQRLAVVNET